MRLRPFTRTPFAPPPPPAPADTPAPALAPLRPQQLSPKQLAWLESHHIFFGVHRKQAEAPAGVAAVASPGTAGEPNPLSAPAEAPTPFITFQRASPPDLVAACRALLLAHDTGGNRTPAIEAIRAALDASDKSTAQRQ